MANILNLGGNGLTTEQLGQATVSTLNTTWLILFIIIMFLMIIITILWIRWYLSFKIKFRIWLVTGTKSLCIDDFARVIRKKGESPKWKLRKRKDFVPIPMDDCISIDRKGKLCVEAYYTENGQYIYKKNINDPNLDINNPLTTIDKEFYANEHIDAVQKYKKKDWLQLIATLAPLLGVIIIVIFMFAFWGQIVKPFMEMGDKIIKERENDREFYLEMHDIHKVIVGNNTNNNIYNKAPS